MKNSKGAGRSRSVAPKREGGCGLNANDVLRRLVREGRDRLPEDTPPRDLRWAVACYSGERMAALAEEGVFSPQEVLEHYLKGLLRDFPGGEDDTARGNALNSIASNLLRVFVLLDGEAADAAKTL